MNRSELTLAILASAGGQPLSPVQLQKVAFLISRNVPGVVSEGEPFEFAPYDYGPFDAAVYREAQNLRSIGLVEIASNGRWNTYAAAPAGVDQGHQILASITPDQSDYIQRVVAWARSLDFATLVKSIYEAYPEMRANSIFQG